MADGDKLLSSIQLSCHLHPVSPSPISLLSVLLVPRLLPSSPFSIPSLVCSRPTHMSSSYLSISLRPSTLSATQRCCLRCQSWIYRRTCTTGWCRSSVITPTGPYTTARYRPRSRYRLASFRVPALAQPRTPSLRLTSDRCTPTTAS